MRLAVVDSAYEGTVLPIAQCFLRGLLNTYGNEQLQKKFW